MQWELGCVVLVFRLKQAKVILKMINLFPLAGEQHLMVKQVSNSLNARILFCTT